MFSDRDECSLDRPCLNGATCTNTPGGYVCNCAAGFYGKNCQSGKSLDLSSGMFFFYSLNWKCPVSFINMNRKKYNACVSQ